MMSRVVHAVDGFLARTETFIYTYVTAHRRFEATVLCHERLNAAEFPFPRVEIAKRPPHSRRAARYWIAAALERATGRSVWRHQVDRILGRVQPALIHAHFGPLGCEFVEVARDAGVPLVTTLYGMDAAVVPYLPEWRAAYDRLFSGGALFLAEGPELLKKIIAAGAPAERTALQPIAIRPERYPRWTPEGDDVLFAGRFVEKKGLLDAIAAFSAARRQLGRVRLVVIGGGPEEAAARAAIAQHRIDDAVTFCGMQSHAQVIDALRRARVLIHPSATARNGDSEGGAPTILLEAQAIGTPIVTTRHADIPHVVPEGPGVWLCDEHNVDQLAMALVDAFERREPSGDGHVRAHHDVALLIDRLEDRYVRLAAPAHERAANRRIV